MRTASLLLAAGLFSSFAVIPSRAEVVLAGGTLTLGPPVSPAPNNNHFLIDVDINDDGSTIASDSAGSEITGTVNAIFEIDISDPANPVIIGIQFESADFTADPVTLQFTRLLLGLNVTANGNNIGGTVFTPSGKPEPVSGDVFDAGHHEILINQGTFDASGTVAFIIPIAFSQDFSQTPAGGPAVGTGTTAIFHVSSTPTSHTYNVALSFPVAILESVPVEGTIVADVNIQGTMSATGIITAIDLPDLKAVALDGDGIDLELSGNVGAVVDLCATDNLGAGTPIATITLDSATEIFTDSAATAMSRRFYYLQLPAAAPTAATTAEAAATTVLIAPPPAVEASRTLDDPPVVTPSASASSASRDHAARRHKKK